MRPLQIVPNCIPAWRIKTALRELLPGDKPKRVGGVWVTKSSKLSRNMTLTVRYHIGTEALTFDQAIAYLENPPPQAQPAITLVQLELPLEREAS
jgi:hypothetical protein